MDRFYFSMKRGAKEFMDAFTQTLAEAHREATQKFVSGKNVHHLRHGAGWRLWSASERSDSDSFKVHSTEIQTSLEDIADHSVEGLATAMRRAKEEMEAQFAVSFYGVISDTCESSGNVVSAGSQTSLAETFYETIDKVEFGVDRFGNVQLPALHAGKEVIGKMLHALETAPDDFKKKFEELKERKTQEALRREMERKARFVSYGAE
ncbi:hypothetical protein ACJ6WI_01130 [Stenotrophomonas maltophilia]|uniref:hypothetical protein n=1 Tax=Stenotrophomonas TaxID=40323 RepID=UPI000586A4DD|nr:hypothetical protein [Stenotrophomonas sp. SKA14]